MAATGTGLRALPSSNGRLGAGHAPIRALLNAGAPVGLGVDGAASQESGMLVEELRQASIRLATARGQLAAPRRRSARATRCGSARSGARAISAVRTRSARSIPGKLADMALWELSGLGHADIADPVGALVFGPPAPLKLLTVAGRTVVRDGELVTADEAALARDCRTAARKLVGGR